MQTLEFGVPGVIFELGDDDVDLAAKRFVSDGRED